MAANGEGTIISNGAGKMMILKGGAWQDYAGAPPAGSGAQPDFKVGDSDAISHAWDVVQSINDSKQLAQKPLATGTLSSSLTSIPIIGGVVGQPRANLQTKLGQVAGDLRQLGIRTLYQQTGQKGVGSVARNQAEQQALQSSLAPIGYIDDGKGHVQPTGAQPDANTLIQGLTTAQGLYYKHLARMYGLNPDDPNTMKLLDVAAKDPKTRQSLLTQAQATAAAANGTPPSSGGAVPPSQPNTGEQITASAPPPAITAVDNHEATSTETQATTDPNMLRIKSHLEQLMAQDPSKVPNSYILNYMHQNGVDPAQTNIVGALNYRVSKDGAAWRARGGNYAVDPTVNVPLTGARKAMATVSGASPGGVPVGATVTGAADAATLGTIPDIAGVVHGITGLGPSRSDVIHARDVSAEEHPYGTFAGNMLGAIANPLARGGGLGRTALLSGIYGLSSSPESDPRSRITNAILSSVIGSATHGLGQAALGSAAAGYRGARTLINPQYADRAALARTAGQMPPQDPETIAANLQNLRAAGATPPLAAAVNPQAQEFLAKIAGSSPAARTVADTAAITTRKELPAEIGKSFDQAIADASEGDPQAFLQRPTREVANDVQQMAGREYSAGMAPIAKSPVTVTPELADTLTHERIVPAIKEALINHNLDDDTRNLLRSLPGQLKTLASANIPGAKPGVGDAIKAQYAKGIGLHVDALRNIATSLDSTASKMQEGSEGQIQLRTISRDIRQEIENQYPEYGPVNARYASRMRSIDAMDEARQNFLSDSPEGIDALAKSTGKLTDVPNEPESGTSVPLPSNRQFAMTGAREAATTRAGSGLGTGGPDILKQLATGPNQQARNAMVLGNRADAFGRSAAAKSTVADAITRVTTAPPTDPAAGMWKAVKRAVATKLTGGVSHYAVGSALSAIPKLGGADAARVTGIFLNANSADEALATLTKAYGAAQARTIMARVTALATAPTAVRSTPIIGAPVH